MSDYLSIASELHMQGWEKKYLHEQHSRAPK
jgi:hypothetical protein